MEKVMYAIVEDESEACATLVSHFKRFSLEEDLLNLEWQTFPNGEEFLKTDLSSFDVVFMDVEMPGRNGVETARELHRKNPECKIIFVTNLAKYAINGYEVGAIDYILKPLYYEDFRMRMYRLMSVLKDSKIILNVVTQDGITRIDSKELLYLESSAHKIIFHLENEVYSWTRPSFKVYLNGKMIEYKQANMQTLENLLTDYGFSQCNSGYLVNLRYCSNISGSEAVVGKENLQISRGRRKAFMDDFLGYISR